MCFFSLSVYTYNCDLSKQFNKIASSLKQQACVRVCVCAAPHKHTEKKEVAGAHYGNMKRKKNPTKCSHISFSVCTTHAPHLNRDRAFFDYSQATIRPSSSSSSSPRSKHFKLRALHTYICYIYILVYAHMK